jgi:hydroxymethylpyrimidine/phosphomethylpyrimidine kinase
VLLKGGHADLSQGGGAGGDTVTDLLATEAGITAFTRPRLATRHTHGTGCTLATAIACGLAAGLPLPDAVERARNYVQAAIAAAPGIGAGHGPLGHLVSA